MAVDHAYTGTDSDNATQDHLQSVTSLDAFIFGLVSKIRQRIPRYHFYRENYELYTLWHGSAKPYTPSDVASKNYDGRCTEDSILLCGLCCQLRRYHCSELVVDVCNISVMQTSSVYSTDVKYIRTCTPMTVSFMTAVDWIEDTDSFHTRLSNCAVESTLGASGVACSWMQIRLKSSGLDRTERPIWPSCETALFYPSRCAYYSTSHPRSRTANYP